MRVSLLVYLGTVKAEIIPITIGIVANKLARPMLIPFENKIFGHSMFTQCSRNKIFGHSMFLVGF